MGREWGDEDHGREMVQWHEKGKGRKAHGDNRACLELCLRDGGRRWGRGNGRRSEGCTRRGTEKEWIWGVKVDHGVKQCSNEGGRLEVLRGEGFRITATTCGGKKGFE